MQKTVQNAKKFCLLLSISQEPYITWLPFMLEMSKIICPGAFFNFKVLIFQVARGLKGRKCPKMTKISICGSLYFRNHISFNLHLWYTCIYERIISPDIFFIFSIFVILDNFLHFYPPKNPKKSKFWKTEKKSLEILSFYTSVLRILIIWYTVPEILCVTDVIVIFHFGLFFALLAPWQTEKSKFQKKGKKILEMSSFYTSVLRIMVIWYTVPEILCVTDVTVIFHFGLFFALLPPTPFNP